MSWRHTTHTHSIFTYHIFYTHLVNIMYIHTYTWYIHMSYIYIYIYALWTCLCGVDLIHTLHCVAVDYLHTFVCIQYVQANIDRYADTRQPGLGCTICKASFLMAHQYNRRIVNTCLNSVTSLLFCDIVQGSWS